MEAWEVLESAAHDIEQYGWSRGSRNGSFVRDLLPSAPRCAMRAIAIASDAVGVYINPDNAAFNGAKKALAEFIGVPNVWPWNDAPGRTKDEVTSTMRAVAASLKAARTEGTRQQAPESMDTKVGAENADALV